MHPPAGVCASIGQPVNNRRADLLGEESRSHPGSPSARRLRLPFPAPEDPGAGQRRASRTQPVMAANTPRGPRSVERESAQASGTSQSQSTRH